MKSSLSRKKLDRIGDSIVTQNASMSETWEAIGRIEEWRASFSPPMRATYMMLRNAALPIDPRAIVSRRLKRMESIFAKLERVGRWPTHPGIGSCAPFIAALSR